jgi:hypothetical protein
VVSSLSWVLVAFAILAVLGVAALTGLRISDQRRASRVWQRIKNGGSTQVLTFDPAVVEKLPEPAQRFFRFTFDVGAPLSEAVEIRMIGEIGLGTKKTPNYRPMVADQILAPSSGFV